MKTIKIQKSGDVQESIYLIINGKTHYMRHQSFRFQVEEGERFEVRVKEFLVGSPKYTFEPKDDMELQITTNNRFVNKVAILSFLVMALAFLAFLFLIDRSFISFLSLIGILPLAIYHFVRIKWFFIVQEIKNV